MELIKTSYELGNILAVRERSISGLYLRYTLFESDFRIDNRHIYSIRLETRSAHGTEISSACDISRNHDEALKLLDLLADGMVTSCTLHDILEDIL